ncbi:MAG: nucleotidyltransferase family protein [Acidimicrobiales bacterium]
MTVAAIILAAGAGSRFDGDGHKLRADFRGRPVCTWVFDAVATASFNQVYVVTGAVDLSDLVPAEFAIVHADDWADGQAHTIQAGLRRAEADGHRAVVIGLADQPLVPASAWRSVGASMGDIVVATFDGQRRPPVKFERSAWPLLPTSGDEGARSVLRTHRERVSEVACTGNPIDIDTQKDLAQWS